MQKNFALFDASFLKERPDESSWGITRQLIENLENLVPQDNINPCVSRHPDV